jgi:1-deoxy-D-xylulose-5-phosphate synthase
MWDMSILQVVPGLHLTAPRDGTRLRQALATGLTIDDAPSVIRYSNQQVPADLDAVASDRGIDILLQSDQHPRVLVVAYGEMCGTGVMVGRRLADQGIGVTVVDPVWALPVNPALLELAAQHQLVITIEDNDVVGGCGSRLAQELRLAGIEVPFREFGIAPEFLEQGSRTELLEQLGLTPQEIARFAVEAVVRERDAHGQGADSARL